MTGLGIRALNKLSRTRFCLLYLLSVLLSSMAKAAGGGVTIESLEVSVLAPMILPKRPKEKSLLFPVSLGAFSSGYCW